MTQTTQQQKPAPTPPRMTLGAIAKGKRQEPISVLLYGVEGIGKSTFGADAPRPIFIDGERGTDELDVARFPTPETWQDVRDAIRTLTADAHEFETLVIDTLDWLEPLLWRFICQRDGKKDVEDYGYGKGYVAALDEWRIFLAALERLRQAKRMHVVLLAHSWIKPFKNPEGDDFDRYEMKLHAKAAGLLKEWPKAVLFANYETIAAKDTKTKRVRGVSTGARFVYTQRTAAYDAKNRYGLPESLPLSWASFYEAAVAGLDPAALKAKAAEAAKALPADAQEKVAAALARAGDDTGKLSQLINWIATQTAQTAQKEQ